MAASAPPSPLAEIAGPGRVARVYGIPIHGVIELGLAQFVRRTVEAARREAVDAILLDINTPGGRVDAAQEIRDALLGAERPVVAFISERALSAGALISLAADRIVMAPAATIGAAEPIPADEKIVSALRGEFEATAQAKGRDPRLAAAMVDKSVAIEGVVEAGKILTLSAARARELGFIDAIASTPQEALAAAGFPDAQLVVLRPNWAERVARFLTEPTVSSLLLTLGFLGLLYELSTAGWGIAGTVGLASLALFFGARILTGLAGWEVLILFAVGMALLLLELVAIPGFGIAGVPGLIAVFASIYLSFRERATAGYVLGGSIVMTVLVAALGLRYMRRTRTWSQVVLGSRQRREEGYVATPSPGEWEGMEGRALTPLRPAGVVEIGGRRLDAVSEGEFVEAGCRVRVVSAQGLRMVVRAVRETEPPRETKEG